ncbi:MAG: aminodeoxychorismate lyase [Cellvibrionaceae bacterium]
MTVTVIDMKSPQYWLNGNTTDTIALNDRCANYGDGLFETLRWNGQCFPLLDLHQQRLVNGCERLLISYPEAQLQAALKWLTETLQNESQAVAKITVTRGQGGRGYSIEGLSEPSVIAAIFPLNQRDEKDYQSGVCVRLCDTALAIQPRTAGIKHLNRLEQVLARAEWQDQSIAEGILRDTNGNVVEGVSHNVFWFANGKLHTPALDECGVAGVMRRFVLQRAEEQGIPVAIERYSLTALALAEEVFLTNSVSGVLPVSEIKGLQRYAVGDITQQLRHSVEELWQG